MADILADGVRWMAGIVTTKSGISCTYIRGSQRSTLNMRRVPQATAAVEIDGRVIEWTPVDFLVGTADLPYGEPKRGDQIRCSVNGETRTHEVFMVGNEKPSRDLADAMTRIHTKVVG